ncbi:LysR substrate binding domain-containing protein [Massilia sp. PDC64]|nr:LysR substrate-binding domain-containing protein [Massilia sp. PDC64]SDD64636.1 LysR substrate binding domain-containing protein [Massilia sp. PDC64]
MLAPSLQVHATIDIRVTFDPARETRCMKMMVSDYATEVFLSQVVARVLRDAPDVTLELVLLADDAAEKLRRGENDFLIIPRKFLDPEHSQRTLFEDHYCAVIWEGNTNVADVLDAATYERLSHIAPMLGRPRSPTMEELLLQAQGVKRRIRVITSDFYSMATALVGTNLVATMHTRLALACAPATDPRAAAAVRPAAAGGMPAMAPVPGKRPMPHLAARGDAGDRARPADQRGAADGAVQLQCHRDGALGDMIVRIPSIVEK